MRAIFRLRHVKGCSCILVVVLCLGMGFPVMAGRVISEVTMDQSVELQHFALRDGIGKGETGYGVTTIPEHEPLQIRASDAPDFEYMAVSPYYKVFFTGTTVKMNVGEAWITFSLPEQGLGKVNPAESVVDKNSLSICNVFESVDLQYTVDTSVLTEMFILKEVKEGDRMIQNMSWEGITPVAEENGSILFLNEEEKEILKILPPFMEDAEDSVCENVHYELIETDTGYELHKVIDEKGLEWLNQAVYPVVIDPSIEVFGDAWESSGLTPYGQYFNNVKEYINPANGHLTVVQNDLVIPGRGLDLVLSRVYETPAVFYGLDPYDYESPPVDVGKGWQLDIPYIGAKYLYLWGGTVYKINWSGNTFENHKGDHFILVKNGDSTYTLTMTTGVVYEFSTAGWLTEMKDLDENSIVFSYTDGKLTSITDTIGRTISLNYSNNQLWKIVYNNEELEYLYDGNGCLVWMEDFLDRRTSYSYNTGYNNWLLSEIEYPTTGYTTYVYSRFSDNDYYKYYVTHQRVYETEQVRHSAFSYTGSYDEITSSTVTINNESDITQGVHYFTISDSIITEKTTKNASGTPIRKYVYTYNSRNEVTEVDVYNDGSHLSYATYFAYDNWGNTIYAKNAEGHEQFFSYANTDTSGFFTDDTGTIVKQFTNAFSNSTVPSSVRTAVIGAAEKQDSTFVREVYYTYDLKAHPTETKTSFGTVTTWLTYSGTFNEKTGQTSFPVDLTGCAVTGNGVLQITGLPSDDTYQEARYYTCEGQCLADCESISGLWCWSNTYYKLMYNCCRYFYGEVDCDFDSERTTYIGPFIHYPGSLGYQQYTVTPGFDQLFSTFTVKTFWKAYPGAVESKVNGSSWKTVASTLKNKTVKTAVSGLVNGQNTLYFSESSSYNTKFSWELYVPVDNTPDVYTTSMQYDTYGNVLSVTDPESHTVTFTYSPDYGHAYLTEISTTVGQDTITTKATYDYYRGWILSVQEPKGVAGSGYDYLYTYDVLGRIIKKEFPLLPGQSKRAYIQAVYDCENRTVTLIDQLRHYTVKEFDKLGRLTAVKVYTGEYGPGTLYATKSYTYQYNDLVSMVTDPGNHTTTYTYDFLGRTTQIQFPDASTVSYSYDDTNNATTFTNGRGYDRIFWFDWLGQLTKVEEEYSTDLFAVTVYHYDEIGHLTSFTDAENRTTSYDYASLFGLTRITYPDSTYEDYVYDNVGNITLVTDANQNETHLFYDALYRLTQIQYQDQSTVSFIYDLNSNRTRMDDNAPNTGDYSEYTYDSWNRLITETRHSGQDVYTVSYQYDTANRLIQLMYPDTMQILYSYDDLNRTTQIKRYIDGITDEILLDNVQYNTESLLTQFDYGNDLRAIFSYNESHRLLTLAVQDGETPYLDLAYSYDNNNNITQIVNGWRDTNSNWHSETEIYSYDGLDRLISASCTSWSHTYTYDKVGNRTGKDGITYTVNVVNQVTALSDGTSFTYDTNGNRTQKTKELNTWVYTYDDANRLTKVEKNDTVLGEYVYDGDGKRILVTEPDKTTTYIYTGLNVLYEKNTTGTACYIYGPTGRLAKVTEIQGESHTYYYHTDHLGSTRLITDESKNIVTSATYEPFGESTVSGEESYLYTGKQKDSTGLYYYGARYYDPDLGQFITRDPLPGKKVVPQSLNRYTYCLNNPVKLVDPAGLTYRMCDVNTGVCIRYYETSSSHDPEDKPDWVAYDANGNKITDSQEMETLRTSENKADQAKAVYLMLLMTHPEIQGDPSQIGTPNGGGYTFWVTIEGQKVPIWIYISKLWQSYKGDPAATQLVDYVYENGESILGIQLVVYQEAFQSIAHLFHAIGHEGCHVYDLITTKGKISWQRLELNGYMWNFKHRFWPFPYPWSMDILMGWINTFQSWPVPDPAGSIPV